MRTLLRAIVDCRDTEGFQQAPREYSYNMPSRRDMFSYLLENGVFKRKRPIVQKKKSKSLLLLKSPQASM